MEESITAKTEYPKCEYIKKDGSKCKGNAKKGTKFCSWHGSQAIQKPVPIRGGFKITESLDDLKHFIGKMINACKDGILEPNRLNSIIIACNALLRIHEIEEVKKTIVQMNSDMLRAKLRESLPEGADLVYGRENVNPIEYEMAVIDDETEFRTSKTN